MIEISELEEYLSKTNGISAIDRGLLNSMVIAYENSKPEALKRIAQMIRKRMDLDISLPEEIKETIFVTVGEKKPKTKEYKDLKELTGSSIDINNHQAFDTSNVSNCASCGYALTHKKSISIAMGPECSGMGYTNEVDWNVVIQKLTTGKAGNAYRNPTGPKYVKFDKSIFTIKLAEENGNTVTLRIAKEFLTVPKWAVVFIPGGIYKKAEKIDQSKRMSKFNKKMIPLQIENTLLIKPKYIKDTPKILALMRLLGEL